MFIVCGCVDMKLHFEVAIGRYSPATLATQSFEYCMRMKYVYTYIYIYIYIHAACWVHHCELFLIKNNSFKKNSTCAVIRPFNLETAETAVSCGLGDRSGRCYNGVWKKAAGALGFETK